MENNNKTENDNEMENNNKKSDVAYIVNLNDYTKRMLKAGMLLDHISKISTYRKKMKNGYAVDLYSAEPSYVLSKCGTQFDAFVEQFRECDIKNTTEKCSSAIDSVIKCFSNTMDQYFDDTAKY